MICPVCFSLSVLKYLDINDSDEDMLELSRWISGIKEVYGGRDGSEIPLHISRFFHGFKMTDRKATAIDRVYGLKEIAQKN